MKRSIQAYIMILCGLLFLSGCQCKGSNYASRASPETEKEDRLSEQYICDFNILKTENEDIRGWLKISDSRIDYPVCQAKDNEYYLSHDFQHNKSPYGCLFLDYRSTSEDTNKVIHGHNMGSGMEEMFSTLLYYENYDWYIQHRYINYIEPNNDMQLYKIFAVFHFDTELLDRFDYMRRSFRSDEELEAWLQYIEAHNIYANDTDVLPEDKILTLSTCNRVYGINTRFLVFAVQL